MKKIQEIIILFWVLVLKKNITLEILPPLYAVMNGVVQKVGLKLTVYSSGT